MSNFWTNQQRETTKYINEHKELPDHIKDILIGMMHRHYQIMSETIGAVALITYREKKDK